MLIALSNKGLAWYRKRKQNTT